MKNYKVIDEGNRWTIGEYDSDHKAYIINDGICGYYYWNDKEAAQRAADAYNAYQGAEWLGQHGYGNDYINKDELEDVDLEMIELYELFDAVEC